MASLIKQTCLAGHWANVDAASRGNIGMSFGKKTVTGGMFFAQYGKCSPSWSISKFNATETPDGFTLEANHGFMKEVLIGKFADDGSLVVVSDTVFTDSSGRTDQHHENRFQRIEGGLASLESHLTATFYGEERTFYYERDGKQRSCTDTGGFPDEGTRQSLMSCLEEGCEDREFYDGKTDDDTSGGLVKDATYVWIIHNDCTRNWLSQPSDAARTRATLISNIGDYPKRHGGTGDYDLDATNSATASTMPAYKVSGAGGSGGSGGSGMRQMLVELKLERFETALLTAGYEDLACFDFAHESADDLINELVECVEGMKKPLARKLIRHLEPIAFALLPVATPSLVSDSNNLPVASASASEFRGVGGSK